MTFLLCCCYFIGLANILTYVLNCQEGSKSKDEVSGPKVCIVENWIQFPVVTLNLSDLIYIPGGHTHRHMNRLRKEDYSSCLQNCNYYDFIEQSLI